MKLALVIAMTVPALARADAPCKKSPCGHVMWDLGTTMVRFQPEQIDATARGSNDTTYHVTSAPGDQRAIVATGGGLRNVLAFASGLYFGSELDIAGISAGPRLAAEVAERGVTTMTESSTGGVLFDMKTAMGWRHAAGSTGFELELSPGFRSAHFTTHDLPDKVSPPLAMWPLLEVHARVTQWISPHFSAAAQVGTDVLRAHDVCAGLMIGIHRDRYR